ncbi:MAG: hypothetical protein IJL76_03330 [Bacilli bacterium]|nr:hypothetical protein [Bacilli bacterium]
MILDFEVNEDQPGVGNNLIRIIFSKLDFVAFSLMKFMYEIFFNVATAEFFSNATIRSFYGRVQLILGVFMVFRLSIVVLQTLIDPEKINDKNEGFGAIIKRVVLGLLLLAALTPINVPNASNDFEIELNNNGLIFGTLYSLQNRILANNTIGRIVLGTTDTNTGTNESANSTAQTDNEGKRLSSMANVFTSTIMRIFVRINLRGEDTSNPRKLDANGNVDMTDNSNWMCDIENGVLETYTRLDADPADLTSNALLTTTCGNGKIASAFNKISGHNLWYSGKARYAFNYIPILGTIVAIIMTVILLGFTVDIAVRAIKLSVLRLIAPIPIIAYMGPQSKDNNAFSNWVKAVVGTYLDLFIRLAVVFFVLFLIQDILVNGITINIGGGIVGAFSMIFIIIGLFIFAKQAPQFIKDVLGIKSFGSNIGLATIMGGLGSIRGGGIGMASGALNAFREQTDAAAQGKQAPGIMDTWRQSTDNMAKIRTGDKQAHGGPLGALQDRLAYQNREAAADRLGIGSRDFARASYVNKANKLDMENKEAEMNAANKDLARYQRNGGMMTRAQLAQEHGLTDQHEIDNAYSAYKQQYAQAEQRARTAEAEYKEAANKYSDSKDNVERMSKERQAMDVLPRIVDVERHHGKNYQGVAGRVQDAIYYREPQKVVTDSNKVAIDSNGQQTQNVEDYQYERSNEGYDGAVDDTTFLSIASGHGTGQGGPSGGGGGPIGGPPPGGGSPPPTP